MSQHKGSVLITGANGGLATSIISQILSSSLGKEYYGIYTVRQPQSASSLQETLKNNPSHKNEIIRLELSSLASVREAAADINKRVASGAIPRIRALILNAAFQDSTSLTMTDDGFDMSFQVNHLSQFLFTLLLLESLDQNHGRIVVVGSWSHDVENPRNEIGAVAGAYNGLKELYTTTEPLARGKWSTPAEDPSLKAGYRRYGATKLCEIMFMNELQARLSRDPVLSNISVLGVDPGGMGTGLLRRQGWVNRVLITKLVPIFASVATHIQPNGVLRPTSKSATDVLRAAFDTEILGEYPKGVYMDGSAKSETGAEAKDERKRAMLWKDSVQYAELREGETVLKEWK